MKKQIFTLLFGLAFMYVKGQISTTLGGQVENLKKDTIQIVLTLNSVIQQYEKIYVPLVNGKFQKELQITTPTYLYATDGINYINGLIEPGDSVTILYDADNLNPSLKFQGRGSEKFSFLTSFLQFKMYDKKEQTLIARKKKYPFDYIFNFIDSAGASFLSRLNSIKSSMNKESFNLLRADIAGSIFYNKYWSIVMIYHEDVDKTLNKRQKELTNKSKTTLKNILKFDNRLPYSDTYVNDIYGILSMYYGGRILSNKADKDIIKKYDYLNSLLPPNLKIPVLTLFLDDDINTLNQGEDIETMIKQTYQSSEDSVYKNYILKTYNDVTSFKKGMNAPDFVLENEKGEKVSLSSFKGKVIYMDFWYAACGPCQALFKRLKPVKEYYAKNDNVIFLCVSIDSKEIWKASLLKYKIEGYHTFTENKEGNDSIIKAYKINGYPTTCMIDKNGKIFMANPSSNPDELKKQIENALMAGSN